MKLAIAASLFAIQFRHVPGPYTLLFGVLELVWSAGFGVWYSLHGGAHLLHEKKKNYKYKRGVCFQCRKHTKFPFRIININIVD